MFACNSSKKMTTYLPTTFDKEAHRGGRGIMPENTIPAMLYAVGIGATTLEMDISISKDKKVFLSHDPFFNHEITTTPEGKTITVETERNYNMFLMNYDSITKYDVGLKKHPRFAQQQKTKAIKPLLADVFDAVKEDMKVRKRFYPFFNIETKTMPETDGLYHPKPEEFVDLLMSVIKEKDMEQYVIIQSFDFRTLVYLHKKYPSIKTAMLVEATDKRSFRKQLNDLGFIPIIYSPAFEIVTKKLIAESHEKNIRIIPWTVNDKNKIEELKNWGVDGIISDYPELL